MVAKWTRRCLAGPFVWLAVFGTPAVAQDHRAAAEPPLQAEELSRTLDRAVAAQDRLNQVVAEFRVSHRADLDKMPAEYVAPRPDLRYNNGTVGGDMIWVRSGDRNRLETRYDLPTDLRRQEYLDKIYVNEPEKQVLYYERAKSAAFVPSGELLCLAPCDWLYPAFRREFSELRASGRFNFAGAELPDGSIRIRITSPGDPGKPDVTADCVISPELDYVITEWQCDAWSSRARIEWTRDAQGIPVPSRAVLCNLDKSGVELRRHTLETVAFALGSPPEDALDVRFAPGTLVTDNRPNSQNAVITYRVDADGELVKVKTSVRHAAKPSRARQIGLGALGVGGVVLALCFRVSFMRSRREFT